MEKYGAEDKNIAVKDSTRQSIEKIASSMGMKVPKFKTEEDAIKFLNRLLERGGR